MAQKNIIDRLELPLKVRLYIDNMDKKDEQEVYDTLVAYLNNQYSNTETRYRVYFKSRRYINEYYIPGFDKRIVPRDWQNEKDKLELNRQNERKEIFADEKAFGQIINQDVDTLSGIPLLYYLMAITGRRKADILYQPFKIEGDELIYIPTKKGGDAKYCVIKTILKLDPVKTLGAIKRVKSDLANKSDISVRVAINAFIVKNNLTIKANDLRAIYNTYILDQGGIKNTAERVVATRQNLCHDNLRSSAMYNFVSLKKEEKDEKKEENKTHKWCEACNTSIRKKGFSRHTRTKKHIENVNDMV